MEINTIVIYVIGGILVLFLLSMFSKKLSYILKFSIRSAIGALGFSLLNMATTSFGITVGINLLTLVFVGLLGIPGFISLYIYQILFL